MDSSRNLRKAGRWNVCDRVSKPTFKRRFSLIAVALSISLLVFSAGVSADDDSTDTLDNGGGGGSISAPVNASGVTVQGYYTYMEQYLDGLGNANDVTYTPFISLASIAPIGGGSIHTTASKAPATKSGNNPNPVRIPTMEPTRFFQAGPTRSRPLLILRCPAKWG